MPWMHRVITPRGPKHCRLLSSSLCFGRYRYLYRLLALHLCIRWFKEEGVESFCRFVLFVLIYNTNLNSMFFFKLKIIHWLYSTDFLNLQNHPSFLSEERLFNFVRRRECFVGLSILLVYACLIQIPGWESAGNVYLQFIAVDTAVNNVLQNRDINNLGWVSQLAPPE